MVGRVLRPAQGKERALLLDHSGTVLRLGFATDDLPLELDDGKANTSASKKQERKASEAKPCPSCKYVRPAGVHACPSCGFAPTRQSDVEVTVCDANSRGVVFLHEPRRLQIASLCGPPESGYMVATRTTKALRPTLADWPKCLNMLVVMGGVEPPTYGL
jgi:RNA polymerase subunit RPABC4/transcription elongation factor Spt4